MGTLGRLSGEVAKHYMESSFVIPEQEFHAAVKKRDAAKVGKMLHKNPKDLLESLGLDGLPILYWVLQHQDVDELLEIMLIPYLNSKNNLNINEKLIRDETILHYACRAAEPKNLLKLMNFNGIRFDIKDRDGNTPLHIFIENFEVRNWESPLKLLTQKSFLDAKNNSGYITISKTYLTGETPLHKAVYNKVFGVKMAEVLLKAGADPNALTLERKSPAHYAIAHSNENLFSLLVKNNADLAIKDNKGKDAMALAEAKHLPRLVKKIKNVHEITAWLENIGMGEYRNVFVREEIYTDLLHIIDDSFLEGIGITDTFHRFKILKACDKFEASSPGLSKNVSGIQMLTRADSMLIPHILRFYDFENIQQIATGRTCEVYKAEYKRKAEVSLKVLSNPSYLDQYKREVGLMNKFASREIIGFCGIAFEPRFSIVTEYCSRGTLYQVLQDTDVQYTWDLVFRFCKQMTKALDTIHSQQMVHRDVNTRNYLVTHDLNIKLHNFATCLDIGDENNEELKKVIGTAFYCPPELVKGEPYSFHSDIYSLSICLWEIVNRLLTGQYALPYDDIESILNGNLLNQCAYKHKRPKITIGCPIPIMVLLGRLWDSEVEERPSASEILQEVEGIEAVYASNKHEWDSLVFGFENIQDNEETDTSSEPPSRESSTELITVPPSSSPMNIRRESLRERVRSKSITDLPTKQRDESPTRKKSGFLRRISQIFA